MSDSNDYHIVYRSSGKWAIKKDGAKRALRVFPERLDAEIHAMNNLPESTLYVHRQDGKVAYKVGLGKNER